MKIEKINGVLGIINSLQQNSIEKEKELANKYWRDENYKIDYQGEELTLKAIYDREIEYAKKHFESAKEIADKIPKDKFVLFVNSAREGTTHYPGIKKIDDDRLKKMVEAETGDPNTHPDDFQAENMRYCLGFKKGDERFKTISSYEEGSDNIDLTNCVGIVYSGSEINVLNEEKQDRIEATERVTNIIKKAEGIPQLGICFGGQLLASLQGADIQLVRNKKGEPDRIVGTPIINLDIPENGTNPILIRLKKIGIETPVAQNHGQEINKESVERSGGKVFAISERGAAEGVLFGKNTICIQFHAEVETDRADVAMSTMNTKEKMSDPKDIFKHDIKPAKGAVMLGFLEMVVENLPPEKIKEN